MMDFNVSDFFPYLVLIISLFKSILLNQQHFKIKA